MKSINRGSLLTFLALCFLVISMPLSAKVVRGTVLNVEFTYWEEVLDKPNETFIHLNNGQTYRFASNNPIGLGQKFKVEIHLADKYIVREDGSINACAARVLALPVVVNGKETLYPVDKEKWIIPLQEDGCNFDEGKL
ncbi:MAG: hypothetical protein OQJ95_02600 [Kangiella sp.]|nr:hypothetical protein [Kangiella sp.]